MLGHHWDTSETPFKWRFADRPMMAPLKWYLDHVSSHQLKKPVKVGPTLTKVSGSAHDFIGEASFSTALNPLPEKKVCFETFASLSYQCFGKECSFILFLIFPSDLLFTPFDLIHIWTLTERFVKECTCKVPIKFIHCSVADAAPAPGLQGACFIYYITAAPRTPHACKYLRQISGRGGNCVWWDLIPAIWVVNRKYGSQL